MVVVYHSKIRLYNVTKGRPVPGLPLLSLGFKSRVSILIYVVRFVCPLSDIEQQDFCHQLRFQSQFQFVVAYDGDVAVFRDLFPAAE